MLLETTPTSCYARQRTEKGLGDRHTLSVQTQTNEFRYSPQGIRTTGVAPVPASATRFAPLTAWGKWRSLPRWVTTTAVTLASTAGFAALMIWMPLLIGVEPAKSAGEAIDAATLPPKELVRRKAKCAECGVIESIQETEGHGQASSVISASESPAESRNRTPPKSAAREITVRLEDGSSRVIVDMNPGRMRLGERVKVIDGLSARVRAPLDLAQSAREPGLSARESVREQTDGGHRPL